MSTTVSKILFAQFLTKTVQLNVRLMYSRINAGNIFLLKNTLGKGIARDNYEMGQA
jgi:hypothetical protein